MTVMGPISSGLWVATALVALVWGAGAFGAFDPWAYTPLLSVSVALGLVGVLKGRGPMPHSVATGLGAIAVATGLQLLPLSPWTVENLSPAALAFHKRQDLAYAAGTVERLTLSIDPARTRLGLAFLVAFGVLLVGSARMLTRDSARQIATGIATAGVALALFGIVQSATFSGKIYGYWELTEGGSPFGPFVNRNHFAGWMLLAIPLTVGLFASEVSRSTSTSADRGIRNRLLWFASAEANKSVLLAFSILTMALSLLLTLSRSGTLSLAGAFLLVAVAMARRQESTTPKAAVMGYLLLVFVVVVFWTGLDRITARFSELNALDISQRPAMWADTMRIAAAFWLTGTGLNTYGVSTLYYQTSVPGFHLGAAHNDYLQLAAEGGLLLAVPILATIAAFVGAVRRRLREDRGSIWWIRVGAITSLLAMAAQSLVEFSLQMPGNAALFAVLCGVALHDGRRAARVFEQRDKGGARRTV